MMKLISEAFRREMGGTSVTFQLNSRTIGKRDAERTAAEWVKEAEESMQETLELLGTDAIEEIRQAQAKLKEYGTTSRVLEEALKLQTKGTRILVTTVHLDTRRVGKREAEMTAADWVKEAEESNQAALELLRSDSNAAPHQLIKEAQKEIKKCGANFDPQVLKKALNLQTEGTTILTGAVMPRNRPSNPEIFELLASTLYELMKAVAMSDIKPNLMGALMKKRSVYKREAKTTLAEWMVDAEQYNQYALDSLRRDPNAPPYLKIKEAQAEIRNYRTNSNLQVLKKALELQATGTGILADADDPKNRPSNLKTFEHLATALYGLLKAVAMSDIKPSNADELLAKLDSDAVKFKEAPLEFAKTAVEAAELVTLQLNPRKVDERDAEKEAAEWLKDAEESNQEALNLLRSDSNAAPYQLIIQAQEEIKKCRTNFDPQFLKKALELQTEGTDVLADAVMPQNRPSNPKVLDLLAAVLYDLLKAVALTDIKPSNIEDLLKKLDSDAFKLADDPHATAQAVVEIAKLGTPQLSSQRVGKRNAEKKSAEWVHDAEESNQEALELLRSDPNAPPYMRIRQAQSKIQEYGTNPQVLKDALKLQTEGTTILTGAVMPGNRPSNPKIFELLAAALYELMEALAMSDIKPSMMDALMKKLESHVIEFTELPRESAMFAAEIADLVLTAIELKEEAEKLSQVASQLYRRSPYKHEAKTTLADWMLDAEQSNENALELLRTDTYSPPRQKIQDAQAEIKKYQTNSNLRVLKKALELQTTGTGILVDAEIQPTNLATLEHLAKALYDLLKAVALTTIKPCSMDALIRKIESDAKQANPRALTKTVVEAAKLLLAAIVLDEKTGEFLSQ
ncbi:unnamed protein product [Nippostrongylus brasiliensis]|uniref:Mitofilin n=1 Tax=Nippostrongylus brasiliensis TaxID=27835 RepID=A0A158R0R5_NIPBR|nr:unnamed protein product [Nippostrongylus brasiliensis]